MGGYVEEQVAQRPDNEVEGDGKIDEKTRMYGRPLSEPLLGKHFELPSRAKEHDRPILDKSLPYVRYLNNRHFN